MRDEPTIKEVYKSNTKKGLDKKEVYYLDQFILGPPENPGFFSASIVKEYNYTLKQLHLCIGQTGNGIMIDLDLDQDSMDALLFIRKITEGLQNLKTAMEKECDQ